MTSSQEEQPPAILLTNPCFTAPWRDAIDANDNILTWLGQDIARVEFAYCHSAPWGYLRSVTSDNLTFTSNRIICDYNRFLRWWIRFEGFFCRLCFRGTIISACQVMDPWRHKSDLWRHRCDTASSMSTIRPKYSTEMHQNTSFCT